MKNIVIEIKEILLFLLTVAFLFAVNETVNGQSVKVKFIKGDHKIDVIIGEKLFTSYQYPADMEKPFLYPVYSPGGSVITRGFPIKPRPKERVDHPHHVGIWFNHGEVNGLDFWNNSSAIPSEKKAMYGYIRVKEITRITDGEKGTLEVISEWKDNNEKTVLSENTRYVFSGDEASYTMDHISTLTATSGNVTIKDNKEGMFAIRVDRAFEMPANQQAVYIDSRGNTENVRAAENEGITGMYISSSGLKGDKVWSSRNNWVLLSGTKDNILTTMCIFDHPKNIGYPAHSHARGYGLFSINNIGSSSYNKDHERIDVTIKQGESIILRHRFYVTSGDKLTPEKADEIFQNFSGMY